MNDIKLAFFLAWKSLSRGNKSSLALVIVIMMIVFLNLLFTDSIFAGISKSINANKVEYQYGEVIIEPKIGETFITDTASIISFIQDYTEVYKIAPITEVQVTYVNEKAGDGRDDERIGSSLVGTDISDNSKQVFDIKSKIIKGRFLQDGDYGKIVIGSGLSGGFSGGMFTNDLGGVKIGERIMIEYGGRRKEYEIIGIFKTKSSGMDRKGFILDKEMHSILGVNNIASSIVLRLHNPDESLAIVKQLEDSQFSEYQIGPWQEKIALGAGVGESFDIIGSLLRVIGSLVAGLVIFIIIFVDIVNKRRQVGILKAIGITEGVIINSYIIRGIFYAAVGSVLGYLLMQYGIVEAFVRHPIDLPMGDVVPFIKSGAVTSSVLFFLVAGLVGSAFPAVQEIRKKILDLLYH